MRIEFKPYRGAIEPVTNVYTSEVNLLKNHIEVLQYYEFDRLEDGTTKPDIVKGLDLYPKEGLAICFEAVTHIDDKDEELFSRLKITTYGGEYTYIWASDKELYDIFKQIKNWLIE